MSPRSDPRESSEFLLIGGAQLSVNWSQGWLFPCEFLVEIGGIGCALDSWEVWWWDPLVVDIVKVDILEEEVSLDILSIGLASTKSSCRVSSQQLHCQWSDHVLMGGKLTR
jgi:hypothetical protein